MEEEKEEVFRKIWGEMFKISPGENMYFDAHKEVTVNNFITENGRYHTTYDYADLEGLDNTSQLISDIHTQEVYSMIKKKKYTRT